MTTTATKCARCDEPSAYRLQGADLCPGHYAAAIGVSAESVAFAPTDPTSTALGTPDTHEGRMFLCVALGLAGLITGGALLLNPGVSTGYGEVANLQKLYLGQTLAIVGAIFMAVGVRPLR